MTDTPAAPGAGTPSPASLAVAMALVTKYRLRLAEQRDSRLGPLAGRYELAAAGWTGKQAALVALYRPPADAVVAAADLEERVRAALAWGAERMRVQSTVERCDILLIAIGPVARPAGPLQGTQGAVRVGAVAVSPATAAAEELLPVPGSLPPMREIRAHVKRIIDGAPPPTLAAVDLAERETLQAGYHQPARRALETVPVATYTLMAVCVGMWILEEIFIGRVHDGQVITHLAFGAAANVGPESGDWWRSFASIFVHSTTHDSLGIYHIAGNMLALFWFGRVVEQMYGRLVMASTFLLTGAAGIALWEAASSSGAVSPGSTIGASGGIAGLLGFLLMMGRVQGRNVPVGIAAAVHSNIMVNLVLNLVFWFYLRDVVNNLVHFGGLAAGIAAGCVIPPLSRIGGRDLRAWERALLFGVLGLCAIALMIEVVQLVPILVSTSPAPPDPLTGV